MTVAVYRIDDRLIHGQVVVGWGQPLGATFIVLVDDAVRESEWEQSLYRMGVPSSMEVIFASVDEAIGHADEWEHDTRKGILLVGSVETMERLIQGGVGITKVNVGGVHHKPGREQRLRYVYLTNAEARVLRELEERGVKVSAQDLPTTRATPLREFA